MLNSNEILEYLFSEEKLWDYETNHEALLLCTTLHEKFPKLRKKIQNHILKGPTKAKRREQEESKQDRDIIILNILNHLKKNGQNLFEKTQSVYNRIIEKYPGLKNELDEESMLSSVKVETDLNPFAVDEITQTSPSIVMKMLLTQNGHTVIKLT